ncbi:hypothetical protein PoB_004587000 [Plakobranchus ocellatus]|uniref:Uncharacterized protein n=1 Tax=Plakobranchus ocellatus TaxID=259542 RepID=A0AAV4BJZ6_9GAST|nr:hypothetical protein PoB_004587000 [Plakobranchus ocellatus]
MTCYLTECLNCFLHSKSPCGCAGRKRRPRQAVAYGLPLVQDKVAFFLHLALVFYPHFLSCAIVPSTSPAVLYIFLFPCGVWDKIDPPYCACRKRRLKQGVAHELPLSGTWATSLSLHLALSSILTSFPALSSRPLLLTLSSTLIHRSPPVLGIIERPTPTVWAPCLP